MDHVHPKFHTSEIIASAQGIAAQKAEHPVFLHSFYYEHLLRPSCQRPIFIDDITRHSLIANFKGKK
jgi:hypothetical protein